MLVPVAPSRTLAETVAYAVDVADGGSVHLVRTASRRLVSGEGATERRTLERAERLAREADPDATVTTALLAADRYLADPADHVAVLEEYASGHGIDRTILDPGYAVDATAPALHAIESLLDDSSLAYERAPVSAGGRLPVREERTRIAAVFALAFGFYLLVSDYGTAFTLLTGAGTAVLAGAVLRNVTFETTPTPLAAAAVFGRGLLFVPYLLWEIGKANAQFAYVVLHPRLPIDPRLDRVDAAVGDGPSVMALANSLTLTPGTLTVGAAGSELLVHSLAPDPRDDLLDGGRERAIRYVFHGREENDVPGPRARGDAELVVGPETPSKSARDGNEREGETNGGTDGE